LLCGDCGGGLADHVNDEVGLGEHDDVAAVCAAATLATQTASNQRSAPEVEELLSSVDVERLLIRAREF
jgi:hypothetical protein